MMYELKHFGALLLKYDLNSYGLGTSHAETKIVRDFQMTLFLKSPLRTDEPSDKLLPIEEPGSQFNRFLLFFH